MDNSKLKQAAALIAQANDELTTSLEYGDMDEYDYEDAMRFASELICEARALVLAFHDEVAPYDKGV